MSAYAAFLGHQPHISIAELSASAPGFSLTKILKKQVLLFNSTQPLNEAFLNTLGGTVVIAKRITDKDLTLDDVPQALYNELQETKGKATFSIRTFGLSPRETRDLYRNGKQFLKRNGKSSRYVGNERQAAASVLLLDEGLIDGTGGCEIVVIRDEDTLWIGKTVAAQNVNAYTERDMKKPVRDTTVGLLPPKLAQILLNLGHWLAREKKNEIDHEAPFTVYDPFCGTGVIPIECLLRGWSILASDASQKAVSGCEKNLEWLRKEKKILKRDVPSVVWKQDATKPFKVEKEKPNAVVTETTLGPGMGARPTVKDAQKLKSENEKLQIAFLKNVASAFPGVPVACTWPVWQTSKGPVRLESVFDELLDIGFTAVLPPGVVADEPSRPTLMYRRPDQFVGREIVLLRPTRS